MTALIIIFKNFVLHVEVTTNVAVLILIQNDYLCLNQPSMCIYILPDWQWVLSILQKLNICKMNRSLISAE